MLPTTANGVSGSFDLLFGADCTTADVTGSFTSILTQGLTTVVLTEFREYRYFFVDGKWIVTDSDVRVTETSWTFSGIDATGKQAFAMKTLYNPLETLTEHLDPMQAASLKSLMIDSLKLLIREYFKPMEEAFAAISAYVALSNFVMMLDMLEEFDALGSTIGDPLAIEAAPPALMPIGIFDVFKVYRLRIPGDYPRPRSTRRFADRMPFMGAFTNRHHGTHALTKRT